MKSAPLLSLILVLLLLNACKDETHVQTGYVSDRDECRGKSENNVGVYSQPDAYPMNDKDHNAALLQLFCECMKDKDWKTAGCPKAAPVVAAAAAPAQPTVVVVQSPTAQPAILPAAAAAPVFAAPVAAHHKRHGKKKRKAVCTPPATCPAPDYSVNTGGGLAGSTPAAAPAAPAPQPDQQLNGILQRQ